VRNAKNGETCTYLCIRCLAVGKRVLRVRITQKIAIVRDQNTCVRRRVLACVCVCKPTVSHHKSCITGAPLHLRTVFEGPERPANPARIFADQPNMLFGTKHFRESCAHVQFFSLFVSPKLWSKRLQESRSTESSMLTNALDSFEKALYFLNVRGRW
jgi:hypothetical protein